MNRFASRAAAILLFWCLIANAWSQGKPVYTWVDENGVVHFVDTPPDNPDAVQVEINTPPPPTGPAPSASAETDSGDESESSEPDMSYADQKRAELAQARQAKQEQTAENELQCSEARAQLEQLEPSRRVYYTNAQGETERMDDEQRVEKVAELQQQVSRFCKNQGGSE